MDDTLRESVVHHRKIVAMHGSAPQRTEPNSVIIALLAEIADLLAAPDEAKAQSNKRAAQNPK